MPTYHNQFHHFHPHSQICHHIYYWPDSRYPHSCTATGQLHTLTMHIKVRNILAYLLEIVTLYVTETGTPSVM